MNKSQLYTLSGALLATTALASVAQAGTPGRVQASLGAAGSQLITTTANIANTLFSTTASTANGISFSGGSGASGNTVYNPIAVRFTNNLPSNTRFNADVYVTGAGFNNAQVQIAILAKLSSVTANTFTNTVTGACGSVTPLVDKILISNCQLSSASGAQLGMGSTAAVGTGLSAGLQLSGIIFNNASGLATVGSTISLSGQVKDNADPSTILETISAGTVVTSAAPVTTTVTAATSGVTNPATTPTAFTSFSSGGGNGNLTLTLATVSITGSGALGTDLSTIVSPDGGVAGSQAVADSVTISVTSGVFSDDAAVNARMTDANSAVTLTPAAFSAGTASFSLAGATFAGANNGVQTVTVEYNGTFAIDSVAAGTVAVAYGNKAGTGHAQAAAAGSGATSAVSSGGFRAEFNTAQASGSDFQSFIRIHNSGRAAGAVTVTVLNDATGASMGSYTTSSIAVGQTLQIGMGDIETGAGITNPSGQYTLQITGPIVGYAQHVLYNDTTGQFSDLSSFRNSGSTNGVP